MSFLNFANQRQCQLTRLIALGEVSDVRGGLELVNGRVEVVSLREDLSLQLAQELVTVPVRSLPQSAGVLKERKGGVRDQAEVVPVYRERFVRGEDPLLWDFGLVSWRLICFRHL